MGFIQALRDLLSSPEPERVTFDNVSITRHFGRGQVETVRWDDLVTVTIVTTTGSPWGEDVFWMLGAADHGCAVAGGAMGMDALLERLQKLPGFRDDVVVEAMGSTGDASFICWHRPT